jgi:hypothetical protein
MHSLGNVGPGRWILMLGVYAIAKSGAKIISSVAKLPEYPRDLC